MKPIAENYFPDIIGTNLQYAVEAYVWETHVPMTEDGKIVSGFWDRRKDEGLPQHLRDVHWFIGFFLN